MSAIETEEKPSGRTRRGGLYVNDRELIEIMGVPYNRGKQMLKTLDRVPGFPKPNPMWGNRRHLELTLKWLEDDERRRAMMAAPQSKPRTAA